MNRDPSTSFNNDIIRCISCRRLVEWRERVACEKVRRFRDEKYWGKPVPSFGSYLARLLLVGLAPAAHGANRTGRMFTGDRSGDWLFRSLHGYGFCNSGISRGVEDGLELDNTRITAVAHCAPPGNRLLREEISECSAFFERERRMMPNISVVVALGRIAFDSVSGYFPSSDTGARPKFSHGFEYRTSGGILVIASYHPSQQNTFTGRLTREMFDSIFERARGELDADA